MVVSSGFRVPGFDRGAPMARFHADLGIVSPACAGMEVSIDSKHKAAPHKSDRFMGPPELVCRATSRLRQPGAKSSGKLYKIVFVIACSPMDVETYRAVPD